jgi:hypothetical protein
MCSEPSRVLRHFETSTRVTARPDQVFAHIDDQARFASHMQGRSLMLGGGRMVYHLDQRQGKAVGSIIRMRGNAFGISVDVTEVITEREPPRIRVWQTIGRPKLVILSFYTMGVELSPDGGGTLLRVWIDYELSASAVERWLTRPLAAWFARWCVHRIVTDVAKAFASNRPTGIAT